VPSPTVACKAHWGTASSRPRGRRLPGRAMRKPTAARARASVAGRVGVSATAPIIPRIARRAHTGDAPRSAIASATRKE
jgi:hypothetical protein